MLRTRPLTRLTARQAPALRLLNKKYPEFERKRVEAQENTIRAPDDWASPDGIDHLSHPDRLAAESR